MLKQKLLDSYTKTRKTFLVILLLVILALAVLGAFEAIDRLTDGIMRLPEALLGADTRDALTRVSYAPDRAITPDLAAREQKTTRARIVWKIYGLESSYGKNDGCKRIGKFNGFGFAQSQYSWQCFDTFAEASNAVHAWVKDKQDAGWTDSQILCRYNTGKFVEDCPYYQKYLLLN